MSTYEMICTHCHAIGELDEPMSEFECPLCHNKMIPHVTEADASAMADVPTIAISRSQVQQYKVAKAVNFGLGGAVNESIPVPEKVEVPNPVTKVEPPQSNLKPTNPTPAPTPVVAPVAPEAIPVAPIAASEDKETKPKDTEITLDDIVPTPKPKPVPTPATPVVAAIPAIETPKAPEKPVSGKKPMGPSKTFAKPNKTGATKPAGNQPKAPTSAKPAPGKKGPPTPPIKQRPTGRFDIVKWHNGRKLVYAPDGNLLNEKDTAKYLQLHRKRQMTITWLAVGLVLVVTLLAILVKTCNSSARAEREKNRKASAFEAFQKINKEYTNITMPETKTKYEAIVKSLKNFIATYQNDKNSLTQNHVKNAEGILQRVQTHAKNQGWN